MKILIILSIPSALFLQHIIRFRRQIILKNLNIVFENQGKFRPKKILKNIYRHFILIFFETAKIPTWSKKDILKRMIFHDLEIFEKNLAKNRGVIVIGGHIGSWELGAISLAIKNFPITVIVKKLKLIDNDYLFSQIRKKHGNDYIYKDDSLKPIFQTLKNNKILAMVIDQSAGLIQDVKIPFLGENTSIHTYPVKIKNKTKAPIVLLFTCRDKDNYHHHVYIKEVKLNETNEIKQTAELCSELSKYIRRTPEQWIWMHNLWKY